MKNKTKKTLPERQLEGRVKAVVQRLDYCHSCPISEDLAEWAARRLGKGLPRKSRNILSYHVKLHLTEGELSVRLELEAAIRNWMAVMEGGDI